MAYGDITNSPHIANSQYREKNGVETVDRAVVIKDASTKGGPAINFLSNHLNLGQLEVKASNRAALYVGVQGDVCVLLSGQSAPISTGTADGNTANKLIDSTASFRFGDGVQGRDIAVNTTDNTAAFLGGIDSDTTLSLVDINNSSVDTFPDGNETYEIYRAVIFKSVQSGTLLPVQVDRVFKLGTTADEIIAIY